MKSLSEEIHSANPNLSIGITMDSVILAKIQSDYSTMIDIFAQNKENVTSEVSINYIGEKNSVLF